MPNIQIQTRRDTAAGWTAANPVLASGELAFETDTGQFKFGDGTKSWTALSYAGGGGGGPTASLTLSSLTLVGQSTLVSGGNPISLLFGGVQMGSVSTNLTNATYNPLPFSTVCLDVATNNQGLYVAVGTSDLSRGTVQWSNDYSTWNNAVTTQIGQEIDGMYASLCVKYFGANWWIGTFGNNEPTTTSSIYSSPDGSNWTGQLMTNTLSTPQCIMDIAYNGSNQYVAVGVGGVGNIYYTPSNPINFIPAIMPSTSYNSYGFSKVEYSNGRYLAVCQSENMPPDESPIIVSTDGSNWHTTTGISLNPAKLISMASNGTLWAAIGQASTSSACQIWSSDGGHWSDATTTQLLSDGDGTLDIIWTGTNFIGKAEQSNDKWITSTDGSNWTGTAFNAGGNVTGWLSLGPTVAATSSIIYTSSVLTAASSGSGPNFSPSGIREITLSTVDTILPTDQLVLVSLAGSDTNPTLCLPTNPINGQRLDIRYYFGTQNINISSPATTSIYTTAKYQIITMRYPDESAGIRGYENLVYANTQWYSLGGDSIPYVPAVPTVQLDFANCSANIALTSITVAWVAVPLAQSYKVFYFSGTGAKEGVTTTLAPPIPITTPPTLTEPVKGSGTGSPIFTGQSDVVTGTSVTLSISTKERFMGAVYAYSDTGATTRLTNFPLTCLSASNKGGLNKLYLTKTQYTNNGEIFYIVETGIATTNFVNVAEKDLT